MDTFEKRELKRKAWARLAAQKRRAGLLRGRVVVLSLVCFAVLWGAVFVQMATGNDPVLSTKEKAAARTVASAEETVETTETRELEPTREAESEEEAASAEEAETEAEPEVEEEAATGGSETAETETLVTSQS
ncbi:MAG: hypothetical protein QM729_03625 [Solirubrobacterales bacterium]